jgi:PAS domain S-box-containing protein
MKPTIMLFGERETYHLLRDSLSASYQVIQPATIPPIDESVDLCIVDALGLAHLNGWLRRKKALEAPRDFPVLLAATTDDLSAMNRDAWYNVDGLVVMPFEPAELAAQVRMLLRTRELTRQLESQAKSLISVSKAIESTSDAISISDTVGKAIYLNQAFTNLYGFQVNELNVRGIPDSLFVNPDVAAEVLATIQNNLSWKGEVALKTKQGHVVPTLLRVDAIEDGSGRRIGLISVHTDITQRKRAEALQREQQIFEKALRDSATALTGTLELDSVLDQILTNIGHVVPHHMAQVLLIEEGVARTVRVTGFSDVEARSWLLSRRFNVAENPDLKAMLETGKPIIRSDTATWWNDTHPLELHTIQSYVSAPIRIKGDTRGFLYLFSQRPAFFTSVHANRLQAFAEHAAIAIQNAQLHEKAQQLAALQERQRLAHELHDAVSQTLYSASVIAEALPRLWERDPAQAQERLAQLHRLTRGAQAELRTMLLELRPSRLVEADFDDLLLQLTEALQGRTHLEVTLETDDTPVLPEDVKTAFFYITQEALNNVVKHARATHVAVRFCDDHDHLELNVMDDGRGFNTNQVESTSMGLGIMRERAEAIGARLDITSQINHGTSVAVIWKNTE